MFSYRDFITPRSIPVMLFPEPSPANFYLADHVSLLCNSYAHYLGKMLIEPITDRFEIAQAIYEAPFVVVSHNSSSDPIFTYGNQAALRLFEMTWQEFTALPSRLSAEPPNREERSRLLETVTAQGFASHYTGIRIAKSGRRFRIEDVTVWNLRDATNTYCGQAAVYSQWTYLS
jgi:hypothetical protein